MAKIYRLLVLALVLGNTAGAATIANMQWVADGPTSGSFFFEVDGALKFLLCNQYDPNVTTGPYKANVATLADLTGTTLALKNDPEALKKYQWVAILVQMALANPLIAEDAVWANRRIVDGTGPLVPGAQTLYDLVMTLNPANYDLSGFKIYTAALSQELGGYDDEFPVVTESPEPGALVLIGSGLAAIGAWRRRRV